MYISKIKPLILFVLITLNKGMADAVRIQNNGFRESAKVKGGSWMDGYKTTGYFFAWLTKKDPDFLKKMNESTLRIIPWSYDGAIKYLFGDDYSVDQLWDDYQKDMD